MITKIITNSNNSNRKIKKTLSYRNSSPKAKNKTKIITIINNNRMKFYFQIKWKKNQNNNKKMN